MKNMMKTSLLLAVMALSSACVPTNQNYTTTAQNAALGAAAGAGLGNLIGGDSEATATGAVIGAAIGSQVSTGNWGLGGSAPQPARQQYTQPQYNQPQYNQPQYNQPQYNQPQYNQYQNVPQNQGYYQPAYGNQPVRPVYR